MEHNFKPDGLLHAQIGMIDRQIISHLLNERQADKVCDHMSRKSESELKRDMMRHYEKNKKEIEKEPHLILAHMCCEHLKDALHDEPLTKLKLHLAKKQIIRTARNNHNHQ